MKRYSIFKNSRKMLMNSCRWSCSNRSTYRIKIYLIVIMSKGKAKKLFVEEDDGVKMVVEPKNDKEDDGKITSLPDMGLTKKGKPRKKREPLSEERKEALREQLKRGRETSALKRQKTAQAKKILKKDHDDKVDEVLRQDLMKKSKPSKEALELAELRKELAELKKPKEVKVVKFEEPVVYVEDKIPKPQSPEPPPSPSPSPSPPPVIVKKHTIVKKKHKGRR
jgi:hypothetical protein